jgi:hypothetical protein
MSRMFPIILVIGLVSFTQAPAHADSLYCIIRSQGQIFGTFPLDKAHVEQCRYATEAIQKEENESAIWFMIACHPNGSVPFAQVQIGGNNDDRGAIVTGCK